MFLSNATEKEALYFIKGISNTDFQLPKNEHMTKILDLKCSWDIGEHKNSYFLSQDPGKITFYLFEHHSFHL